MDWLWQLLFVSVYCLVFVFFYTVHCNYYTLWAIKRLVFIFITTLPDVCQSLVSLPVGIAVVVGNDICVGTFFTEVNAVTHLQPVQQRHPETQTTMSSRVSSSLATQSRTQSKLWYDRVLKSILRSVLYRLILTACFPSWLLTAAAVLVVCDSVSLHMVHVMCLYECQHAGREYLLLSRELRMSRKTDSYYFWHNFAKTVVFTDN